MCLDGSDLFSFGEKSFSSSLGLHTEIGQDLCKLIYYIFHSLKLYILQFIDE